MALKDDSRWTLAFGQDAVAALQQAALAQREMVLHLPVNATAAIATQIAGRMIVVRADGAGDRAPNETEIYRGGLETVSLVSLGAVRASGRNVLIAYPEAALWVFQTLWPLSMPVVSPGPAYQLQVFLNGGIRLSNDERILSP